MEYANANEDRSLPSTTNRLLSHEGAELAARSHKFMSLLGERPGADALVSHGSVRRHSMPCSVVDPENDHLRRHLAQSGCLNDERRRKWESLAKLHRFLGTRVPAHLVFRLNHSATILPPEHATARRSLSDEMPSKHWIGRRTSCPLADNLDRSKDELDEREKALNVRRAQKMEKVFGVAPPLTLFHTRCSLLPSSLVSTAKPPMLVAFLSSASIQRKSKYLLRRKARDLPSESQLLFPNAQEFANSSNSISAENENRHSIVYDHYQQSLNSLNYILDRDDTESLVELHGYLNRNVVFPSGDGFENHHLSLTSMLSNHHSLPTRASNSSLFSEYVKPPRLDIEDFQKRRRKAAKLTQFFGVDYRILINDILESLKNGLQNEHDCGTICSEEVEVLLQRLQNFTTKEQGFHPS